MPAFYCDLKRSQDLHTNHRKDFHGEYLPSVESRQTHDSWTSTTHVLQALKDQEAISDPLLPNFEPPRQLCLCDTGNCSRLEQLQTMCLVAFGVDQKTRSCGTFRERMTSKCTVTGQNLFLNEYLIRRCKYFFK